MNHDYAHCMDFSKYCPKECRRAQLARDLNDNPFSTGTWHSWARFKGTDTCPDYGKDGDHHD